MGRATVLVERNPHRGIQFCFCLSDAPAEFKMMFKVTASTAAQSIPIRV